MIIKNYKDKKYIETTDNEVIFYRLYGKRVLKKDKIRAAYMQDDYTINILYGKAIRSYNICNVKSTEKIKLKGFIDSLNNKELIFSWVMNGDIREGIIGLALVLLSKNIYSNVIVVGICIAIIVVVILNLIKHPPYNIFIYDYKNKIITIEAKFPKKKKEIKRIGEDILSIKYNKSRQYIIKMKFNTIILQSNIVYPIQYLEAMKEVYENHDLHVTHCYKCGKACNGENICSSCGKKIDG